MTDQKPLRRMTEEEASKIQENMTTTGPLTVGRDYPELLGDTDFTCPSCGVVLIEKTHAEGVKQIRMLRCYNCGATSSGDGLPPRQAQ